MRHESIADEHRHAPAARQAATRPRSRVTGTGRHLYAMPGEVQLPTKEPDMAAIGRTTSVLLGLILIAGVVIGVQSVPDLKRYLRIRRM
ncbi:DUF6893 family small protein [Mycobacterium sp.]|uniref:DUF6893 family small protein n=1 Tax=Mycobacterium sp. TaxID=1785 RepID=UPI003D6A1620